MFDCDVPIVSSVRCHALIAVIRVEMRLLSYLWYVLCAQVIHHLPNLTFHIFCLFLIEDIYFSCDIVTYFALALLILVKNVFKWIGFIFFEYVFLKICANYKVFIVFLALLTFICYICCDKTPLLLPSV